jgi:hypothetical protein
LTYQAEAKNLVDVIGASSLFALKCANNCREYDKLRPAKVAGQDIGVCAEMLDIGEQIEGHRLHEGLRTLGDAVVAPEKDGRSNARPPVVILPTCRTAHLRHHKSAAALDNAEAPRCQDDDIDEDGTVTPCHACVAADRADIAYAEAKER